MATPPVEAAKTTGTLVIDSTPWGTASGSHFAPGVTPRRVELPPGTHDVSITLSEGGGTFSARATVEAGRRTKCVIKPNQAFACEPPR